MLCASFLRPVCCSTARRGQGRGALHGSNISAVHGVQRGHFLHAPRAAYFGSCAAAENRHDAAWLDQEELLYRRLLPDGTFFKELEGEVQYAHLDDMVNDENWEALAEVSRGLSIVFGSKVCLTLDDGLDLDLKAPFTPAINGTASNK